MNNGIILIMPNPNCRKEDEKTRFKSAHLIAVLSCANLPVYTAVGLLQIA